MTFHFEQIKHIGILRLSGELTHFHMHEVRKALLIAFTNADHIIVDFKGALNMDDSFIDQFKQAKLASGRMGKRVTLINVKHAVMEVSA